MAQSAVERAEGITLAIDVGATRTRLALVEGNAVLERVDHRTAQLIDASGSLIELLTAEAERLAHAAPSPGASAAGVGLAAFVDPAGSVLQAREFGIPAGSAIRHALSTRLAIPVAVENDGNLAALAEHELGAARGTASAAVLSLGTNIGLGLVLEGGLYRGAHGVAGEAGLLLVPARATGELVGALPIVDAGPLGRVPTAGPTGYARIEELVGGGALAAAAGPAERVFDGESPPDGKLRHLAERALEGWALLIADLSVILDVELFVLTGALAADAAHLLDRLRRRVEQLVPFVPEIRLGSLGPDAVLLGADLAARTALAERAVEDARAGLTAHAIGGVR